MYLICINYNNIINKPFSAEKKNRSNTLYMCLDIHAKFCGDWPLRGRDLKEGGQIAPPPPPCKNLLSKTPVKIGLSSVVWRLAHCKNRVVKMTPVGVNRGPHPQV